jgi:PAS domain S-box-containing protein
VLSYADAYHYAPIAVSVADFYGRILYVNPAFEDLMGYASADLEGEEYRTIYSPLNPDGLLAAIAQDVLNGKIWSGRVWNRRKDGSDLWSDLRLQALTNSDGEISAYVCWIHDTETPDDADPDLIGSLAEASALVTQRMGVDELLMQMNLLIRKGLRVDRAGFWRKEEGGLRGTWGTDGEGRLLDESSHFRSFSEQDDLIVRSFSTGKSYYSIERFQLTAPILVNGESIGALSVDNFISGRAIGPRLQKTIGLFADYLGIGFRNAYLQEEVFIATRRTQKQASQLRSLLLITRDLTLEWKLESLFQEVIRAATQLLDAPAAALYRFHEGELERLAGGQSVEEESATERQVIQALALQSIESNEPIIVRPPEGEERISPDFRHRVNEGGRNRLILPIPGAENPQGVLIISENRPDRRFSEEEIIAASHLAASAGVAIQSAEHIAEIERLNCEATHALSVERELAEQRAHSERMEGVLQTVRMFNHEINNPLQVVLGNAQLLELKLKGHPEGERLLNRLIIGCQRLSDVSLRLSRVVRASTRMSPVGEMLDLEGSSEETAETS